MRLGHILGQIMFLGHALSAHMLAPSTHRLQAVGGINMQDYAAMPNSTEPNSGVIPQIVMEQMPLTLTFARIGQLSSSFANDAVDSKFGGDLHSDVAQEIGENI